jgi:predicted RNA-binding protein YlxR (DUF448 family)
MKGAAKSARSLRPRAVPQRTCIGCREEEGKQTFVRIVRTPGQLVVIDPTGKANGRGAYLHRLRSCWEKALKGGTMNYALKITPAPEDMEALRAFAMSLPADEESDLQ